MGSRGYRYRIQNDAEVGFEWFDTQTKLEDGQLITLNNKIYQIITPSWMVGGYYLCELRNYFIVEGMVLD